MGFVEDYKLYTYCILQMKERRKKKRKKEKKYLERSYVCYAIALNLFVTPCNTITSTALLLPQYIVLDHINLFKPV